MPKPYPEEFRNDVVACAVNRETGITIEQIAHDFGIHPMTLTKWMRHAQAQKNAFTGMSAAESAALRRKVRLLEEENEILRRAAAYFSQTVLPGKGGTRS